MRRFPLIALFLVFGVGGAGTLAAAPEDNVADRVLGQPGFTTKDANLDNTTAATLVAPSDVAVAPNGRLYVSDQTNHRILSWPSAVSFTNQQPADRVIGQPDFTSRTENNGGVSALSLFSPTGIAVDAAGNLYVADLFNHRVLEYDDPATTDAAADRVFGQPNFTSGAENNGGISASSLRLPQDVEVDPQGNVYVAEFGSNRVLIYDTPLTQDRVADAVLGQPDFVSNAANNGGLSASSLFGLVGLGVDASRNVYVADTSNSRVLKYLDPRNTDRVADQVFGQPNFTTDTKNFGGLSASSLFFPYDVFVDGDGNIYVADGGNARILRYDVAVVADVMADFVIGQVDFFSGGVNGNGIVKASSLNGAKGMDLDAAGDLIVADQSNHRVLAFDAADPGSLNFSSALYSAGEADGTATVTVLRAGDGDGAVSVDYAAAAGTATADTDFTPVSGTLNFADGELSKTFTVDVVEDASDEDDETVLLTLTNPTGGATLGAVASATLTLLDNDGDASGGSSGGCALAR